jgi:hypothetical protein
MPSNLPPSRSDLLKSQAPPSTFKPFAPFGHFTRSPPNNLNSSLRLHSGNTHPTLPLFGLPLRAPAGARSRCSPAPPARTRYSTRTPLAGPHGPCGPTLQAFSRAAQTRHSSAIPPSLLAHPAWSPPPRWDSVHPSRCSCLPTPTGRVAPARLVTLGLAPPRRAVTH